MKSKLLWLSLPLLMAACVPQRQYQDLQAQYEETAKARSECEKQVTLLKERVDQDSATIVDLNKRLSGLQTDTALLGATNRKMTALYDRTNTSYENLLEKVKEIESRSKLRTDELATELLDTKKKLDEKEKALNQKESDLKAKTATLAELNAELEQREKRVAELSRVLNQKDSVVKDLRNSISKALLGYADKGLTVDVRNGKVYVSVEDKLLFESGKYTVNSTGKQALLQLAQALKSEPDVTVMVEGHTDNVPYKGSGVIKDNLDLSVMRATEVARILGKEGKLDAERIVAAGRGESQPIATNDTAEGRAKNRRTEIILTPQLSELFKILGTE